MKPIPDLKKIVGDYRSLQRSRKHLEYLEVKIYFESDRLDQLEKVLDKEHQDVLDFESKNIRGLFRTVLGKNEEQYEIEKQEYLMAALQYNEAKKVVDLLNFEKKIIKDKLEKEKEIKAKFDQLVFQRNEIIAQEYPYLREQLNSIVDQLDNDYAYLKELSENILIAKEVEGVLLRMIGFLEEGKELENWGESWQEINQINYVRNLTIDKAVDLSCKAKQLLLELENQLEDIYQLKSIKRFSRFEEFHHFNDIYYDRLISDWIVKKKISSSINFLIGTNDSVERVIATLENQIRLTNMNIKYLRSRQKEVVVESIK